MHQGMASRHYFHTVLIQTTAGFYRVGGLGGSDVIAFLEKWNNLLKFGFVKNGPMFADFNFSKKT